MTVLLTSQQNNFYVVFNHISAQFTHIKTLLVTYFDH
jgi:hypothetical protein